MTSKKGCITDLEKCWSLGRNLDCHRLLLLCSHYMKKSLFYIYFNTTEPADYSPVISQQVTFPAGSGVGSQQCININIANDNIDEDNEQFSLSLTAGQNSAIGNPGAATVTIIDDDGELVSLGSSENNCSKPSCV